MRFLLALVLLAAPRAPAAPTSTPDAWPGRPSQIAKPEKFVGAATPLEVAVDGARRPASKLSQIVLEQNGKQTPLFTLGDQQGRTVRAGRRGHGSVIAREIGKQSVPDLQVRGGAHHRHAPRVRCCAASGRSSRPPRATCRSGSSGRASRSSRPITTSTSAAPRWCVYRVTPEDVDSGVLVGDVEYPGFPASGATVEGVKITDPGAAGRVLRAALRPGPQHADPGVRARRGGQHRARRLRLPHVPEAVQAQPHRARRQVPRPRRAGDPRGHDRGQARGGHAREVPRDQRRAAPEERREDRLVREADLARDAVGRRRVPPVHEQRRRVRVRRSAHLHLQGQGGRPADPPRLRPRVVRRHADRRGEPRQGAVRRGARDLRQLRDHRPRHGRAVALRAPVVDRREGGRRWSRRSRRSAAAA